MSPSTKVTSGALAGAFTIILVWLLQASGTAEVPGEAAAAITTVFAFVVSYFVPETNPAPSSSDQ